MSLNPLDLPGPEFLLFFTVVSAATILLVYAHQWYQEGGNEGGVEAIALRVAQDPCQIAYLRGGPRELILTSVVSLLERGLLRVTGSQLVASRPEAADLSRRPLEKAILVKCAKERQADQVFTDRIILGEAESVGQGLVGLGLLPSVEVRASRRLRLTLALTGLGALACLKVLVALSRGRHNLLFLLALVALACWIVKTVVHRPRTALGGKVWNKVLDLFNTLKIPTRTDPKDSTELTFSVAIGGLAMLPSRLITAFAPLRLRRAAAEAGGWGGESRQQWVLWQWIFLQQRVFLWRWILMWWGWLRRVRELMTLLRDRGFFGRRARQFTLQWHLTNACTENCAHCYDRSDRETLPVARALEVLEEFRSFCRDRRVAPRICLTGGDPMKYLGFWELYRAIAGAGIPLSILGNPIAGDLIQRMTELGPPLYYQVSLEGHAEHNDAIRGQGHFRRTMDFLRDARRLDLTTHVMLTLTRANLEQVLPLGTLLRGLTERLTFNRLSQVGAGRNLDLPTPESFDSFLREYVRHRRTNPILGLKDNLFNALPLRKPFGGCTGHGCGAAFNFVALLPEGAVHACRKYPSPLGHLNDMSLGTIYDSVLAKRYRCGPAECHRCRQRNVCGGCPAVTYGQGLDPMLDRDPFCRKAL